MQRMLLHMCGADCSTAFEGGNQFHIITEEPLGFGSGQNSGFLKGKPFLPITTSLFTVIYNV